MKRFYLILLGVSLLSLSSFAGSLFPTVITPNADVVNPIMWYGKIWNVRYDFIDDSHQSLVLYSDVTESIVGGKTYVPICVCERKLIVRGVTLRSDINQSEATRLLYRQEGDKVYYLSQENNAEFILFDYGLKEGEKFKAQDGEQYVVTETGYFEEYDKNIYAPGQNKPRMLRLRAEESGKEDVWIEGIGSVKWGIVPKYVLKASAVFKDTPIDAHVFRSSTNGDIAIYDYLFNINEENYKLINYELGEECSKEEDGLSFTFIEDTLCVSGSYCPVSSFGPECIECLVTSDNTIVMAFYGFHVITTNSTYRKIDVKIPGFKAGTYIFGTETLVCKGKNPDKEYHPFIEEGKVWELGFIPNNGDSAESLNFFYLDGDTIVNDIRCSKMMLQYVDKESRLTTYAASIYEHEGQVHCAFHGSETFELLYDFVAKVGDTIEIYDPQNLWGTHHTPAVIVSKEHGYDQKEPLWEGGFVQYIKGTVTKVAAITPYNKDLSAEELAKQAEWWIEGVGYMGNPLNNILVEQVTGGYDALMQCTIDADTLYYTSRYTEDVTQYWSDEDSETKKQKIDFTHVIKTKPTSPQLVSTNISLLWGEYSNAVLNIDFEGMNGRYKINVRKDGEQQDRFSANQETHNLQSLDVNLAGYPDGDYTVVVENDGESFTAHFALPLDGTGISPIHNSQFKIDNNAPVYDLSGRRVSASSAPKGIYIQGNKKIVKK